MADFSTTIGDRAAKARLVIEQGTDVSLEFAAMLADGSILDTSGYTARAQIRPTETSSTLLLDMTTANGRLAVGIVGTAPDQYNVAMTIDKGTTNLLTDWGIGVWQMTLTDGFSHTMRLFEGPCVLSLGAVR